MTARLMRVWRGQTRRADADEYERYMRETGFVEYSGTEGNRGVYMTRRDIGDNTEFCMVSLWETWDAVRAFAGDEPGKAVFYPEDDRFLVARDLTVDHYVIFAGTAT